MWVSKISRKGIFLLVVRTARRTGRMVRIERKVSQEQKCERKIGTTTILQVAVLLIKATHKSED